MDAITLAGVAIELAERFPDRNMDIPRAEWRWNVIELAIKIVREENITPETDDIDEVVARHLMKEV